MTVAVATFARRLVAHAHSPSRGLWLNARLLLVLILLTCAQVPHAFADGAAHNGDSQQAAGTTQPPAPLALPKDPNTTCGKDVFLALTKTYSCPWEHYPAENPDHGCCEGLAIYFGLQATKPSKHCLCVPEVWAKLSQEEEYHRIPFERIFKFCTNAGHVIPFYQAGSGYCNGTKDDEYARADWDAHYHEAKALPSLSNWVSRLHKSWIMHLSFVSGIASVPGFLMFLWPFVFDTYFTIKEAVVKHQTVASRP